VTFLSESYYYIRMVIENVSTVPMEQFEEETDFVMEKQFMVLGVYFIQITDTEGATVFYLVDDNELVHLLPLGTHPEEFVTPSNKTTTFSTLLDTGEKVMVDDNGIHSEW